MLDDFKNILILSIERLSKGRSNMTTIKLIRQDKTRQVRGLFYLIAAAIMVAIMGISCSSPAKPLANFNEEAVEIPVTSENQTSSQPALTITKGAGAGQFVGKSFTDGKITLTIVERPNPDFTYSQTFYAVTSEGTDYCQIHYETFRVDGQFNITHNNSNGLAEFRKSGDLLIWYNSNMSDLKTFKLVK